MNQNEITLQTLAVQTDLEIPLPQHFSGFRVGAGNELAFYGNRRQRLPCAHLPHHHRASAVVAFGNNAFEIEIRYGMILDLHGQAFVGWVERKAFGHSPGFQHAIHLQAKIIVQAGGAMFLHYEAMARFLLDLPRRLGSFSEAAFALVFFKSHTAILANGGYPGESGQIVRCDMPRHVLLDVPGE